MSASCQTYAQASNASIFDNSCAIQKSLITPDVTTALKTCCVGGGGVQTTSDGCFTYCNITNFYDTFYWNVCLLDNLSTSESAILFEDEDGSGCDEDLFSGNSSATTAPVGNIAMTWVGEGQTLTLSSGGTAIETTVLPTGQFLSAYLSSIFGGDATPTTSGVSETGSPKPAGTASGKASTTTGGPASTSSKPNKASGGLSVSKAGAAVVVGLVLFTAWL
ncbi:hypothetical protein L207DRAFT_507538 [Hyaloscypha variabilis F]|uniref:Uncharacterized protein n=1 Tax=Hyaloscypha variabilis (strain UAMH 11265 / GT02V1 / F) TaxID=1149755 RepID=A0A2J6S7A2_HYAVF|nr:hypothetical protein L207DRAFT_507538 [Hyaloscypha variabilis F]